MNKCEFSITDDDSDIDTQFIKFMELQRGFTLVIFIIGQRIKIYDLKQMEKITRYTNMAESNISSFMNFYNKNDIDDERKKKILDGMLKSLESSVKELNWTAANFKYKSYLWGNGR